MDEKTTTRIQQLPGLAQLGQKLERDWDHESDPEAARETAREIAAAIETRRSPVNLEHDYRIASHAAEILGDSLEYEDALRIATAWRRTVADVCSRGGLDPWGPRIWAAILSARVAYRGGEYRAAFEYVNFGIQEIRIREGGAAAVHDILRHDPQSEIAEIYCALLAAAIPIGRRFFSGRERLRMQFLGGWLEDAKQLLDHETPPQLWRIHGLVCQTFLALAAGERSDEAASWLDHLQRFDQKVRPVHSRGKRTSGTLAVARACFDGDRATRRRAAYALQAEVLFLPRHTKELAESGALGRAASA